MEVTPQCLQTTTSAALLSYVDAQSPTTTWRRNAENDLIQLNLLHPSEAQPGEIHTASMISSIFVLLKSTIGTSIYVLPYAFAHTGWILGIIFLIFGCLVNIFSLHLLAICSQYVHPSSFYTLTKITFPHYVILIDSAIALDCLGTAIAYLVVIGGIMPQVMEHFEVTGILLESKFWITISFIFCIPFSFIHHISAFKWTSALADLSVAFFCVILILYSTSSDNSTGLNPCDKTTDCTGTTSLFALSINTVKVFSIYSMAFNCQMVIH